MYTEVTNDIEVTARPEFRPYQSEPEQNRWFWAYTIEIANAGERTVQLVSRHWVITDAEGVTEEVKGLGVVGEQPILRPGESFRYTSGCPLGTPSGIMKGSYQMRDDAGQVFEVAIPAFSLDSPEERRVLN